MQKLKWLVAGTLIAGFISGCIVHTRRACHDECWWDHGRRVCERRC